MHFYRNKVEDDLEINLSQVSSSETSFVSKIQHCRIVTLRDTKIQSYKCLSLMNLSSLSLSNTLGDVKNTRCVARHVKNLVKEELKSLHWLKILIVSDVSDTTVAFFSKG